MKSHVLALALLVGCVETPVATTTTTGGVSNDPNSLAPSLTTPESPPIVVLADDAAARIASIRCSMEYSCGNVGESGSFATFDACIAEVRATNQRQLAAEACPKGVDPYALDRCADDERLRACGMTPGSYTTSRLCRR